MAALQHESVDLALDVVTTNARAIRFYEELGAVPLQEFAADWAPCVTEVRMVVPDLAATVQRAAALT